MTNFTFQVLYKNGDKITLLDKIGFEDIPLDGLIGIVAKTGNSELLTIHLEEGQKLIFRKRSFVTPGISPEKQKNPIVYMMGVRQLVNGTAVQFISYICDWPDRGFVIHQAGKFRENHPWFESPFLKINEVFEGERYYDPKNKLWKTK